MQYGKNRKYIYIYNTYASDIEKWTKLSGGARRQAIYRTSEVSDKESPFV